MRKWLNKPYPFFLQERLTRIKISLFVFLFVFCFLAVFQPFHLKEFVNFNIYIACLLYAFTSAVMAFLYVTAMVRMFPNYASEKNWTIAREFLMMASILIVISFANFFLGLIVELHPANYNLVQQFLDDMLHTFVIGLFPVMVITFTTYTVMLRRNLSKAESHNKSLTDRGPKIMIETSIRRKLTSPTNNNDFELDLDDLIFIMADGNYIEFHFVKEGNVVREIKRNTLNNIEDQLKEYPFIFRTHRAYMVHLDKIVQSKGNAQGYQIKLDGIENWVPVSRGNLAEFDEVISNKGQVFTKDNP